MNSIDIYSKIDRLRKNKGWSINYLSTQAGVSHNTLYTWRTRRTMPSFEVLEALCDALNISLAQLFSTEEKISELSEECKKLFEYWSTLTRKQKDLIMNMILSLREVEYSEANVKNDIG